MFKRILFVLFSLSVFLTPLISFGASLPIPSSPDNVNIYSVNPSLSVVAGYNTEYEPSCSINRLHCSTSNNGSLYTYYSGFGNSFGVNKSISYVSNAGGEVTDFDFALGSLLYDTIDYFSVHYASIVNVYQDYERLAHDYALGSIIYIDDNVADDIQLEVTGDIILYFAPTDTYNNAQALRIPLSRFYKLTDYSAIYPTIPSTIRNNAISNKIVDIISDYGYNSRYAYMLPLIQSVALDYYYSLDYDLGVPNAYSFDNVSVTVSTDSSFIVTHNNVYSYDLADTNGDNFYTDSLMLDLIDTTPIPDDEGFGLIDSVSLILETPFLFGVDYISWFYLICGVILFRYMLRLFLGG